MKLRWQTVGSRIIVSDRWAHLRADQCVTPNGAPLEPYYVLEYPDWVSVQATDEDGKAILVREYRHGASCVGLGLVGGGIQPSDASPTEAAIRELVEETGYQADDIVALGSAYANWGNQNNRVHYFLARGCQLTSKVSFDPAEQCELVIEDVSKLFEPGFFLQSFHLANAFLARENIEAYELHS